MAAERRATGAGFAAIALWALLALFTTGAAGLPRFELLALTLGLAGATSLAGLAVCAPLTPSVAAACGLIVGGGLLAAGALRKPLRR